MSEWYEKAFDADYLECYQMFEAEQVVSADCNFILNRLELSEGASVLDVCSGSGRHSIELARRGYAVTGLDVSPSMIDFAKNRAVEAKAKVEWVCCDAKKMDYDQQFDGAFNYLTSLGMCDDEGELTILRGILRALKPGGHFLVEMINMVWLMGNFVPTERRVYEKFTYIERRRFDARTGIIHTQREKRVPGAPTQELMPFEVRALMPWDVVRLLETAGFEVGGIVTSPTGRPVQIFSTPRLGIVAARPL